jgi:hypothetical protein
MQDGVAAGAATGRPGAASGVEETPGAKANFHAPGRIIGVCRMWDGYAGIPGQPCSVGHTPSGALWKPDLLKEVGDFFPAAVICDLRWAG